MAITDTEILLTVEERDLVASFIGIPAEKVAAVEFLAGLKMRSTERTDSVSRTFKVAWSERSIRNAYDHLTTWKSERDGGHPTVTDDDLAVAVAALAACGAEDL